MPRALTLVGVSGSQTGRETVVTDRTSIVGSAPDCHLRLRDRLVMPRHAEIRAFVDRWLILSLDPAAAIFVNGEPVTSQQRLDEGDLITVGTVSFRAAIHHLGERQVGGATR